MRWNRATYPTQGCNAAASAEVHVGFFRKFFSKVLAIFSRRAAERPILLRVDSTRAERKMRVQLEATWLPSSNTFRSQAWLVDGMCILPWRVGQRRVRIGVILPGERGHVELTATETGTGNVHRVTMQSIAA
jgi:hypothetical protein